MRHDPYPLPSDSDWQGPHPGEAMFVGDPDNPRVVVCTAREVVLDSNARPVVTVVVQAVDTDGSARMETVRAGLVGYGKYWAKQITEFANAG